MPLSRKPRSYILLIGLLLLAMASAQSRTTLSASSNTIAYIVNTDDESERESIFGHLSDNLSDACELTP